MWKSLIISASASLIVAVPASAQEGTATFELPRLKVTTYRKPYVAVWLEDATGKQIKVYSVIFDQSKIGERWLPDLKTWWRRGGRAMNMAASGISRPTRGPGQYKVAMGSLSGLSAGKYALVVEAARENGGREIVKAPFDWKPGTKIVTSASGSTELGRVSLTISG